MTTLTSRRASSRERGKSLHEGSGASAEAPGAHESEKNSAPPSWKYFTKRVWTPRVSVTDPRADCTPWRPPLSTTSRPSTYTHNPSSESVANV